MKYICNENGEIFEGSSFVNKCPECDSTNIQPYKEKGGSLFETLKDYILKNKIVFGGIFIFLFLLILKPSSDDGEKQLTKYELDFVRDQSSVKLILVDENKQRKAYNSSLHAWLNLKIRFIDDSGLEYILSSKQNAFLACENGDVVFSWDNNSKRLLGIYSKINSKRVNDLIKSSKCNDCCLPLVDILDVNVNQSRNCLVSIKFNIDFDKNVMVSINGKNGEYKNKQFYEYEEDMDIWAYYKGSKDYKTNYKQPIDSSCKPPKKLTVSEINVIKTKTENILIEFLENSDNPPNSFWIFYDQNPSVKFVVKGNEVGMSNIGGYIDNLKEEGFNVSLQEVIIDAYGKCTNIKLTY